ncbi:hypothetical protein [Phytohabitans houttuyneae]|uniref:Uncharacterized protein n=1 Tax=Phytohabitans houttuyneae TaxID=1076126 RepID=A0A6V8K1S7_9ACTN|nr:hypothetical protein [Phytohabitans houttuyneae]GFJ76238.1 hypothetical protein Phou_004180 [Phytohabitans houttuyneae]
MAHVSAERAANTPDPHRERRRAMLAGVAGRLREVGIGTAFGPLESYRDFYGTLPAGTAGLVCEQPPTTARLQVTAILVRRTLPPGEGGLSPDRRSWVRDADVSYDLDGYGEPAFEVTILEDPDDGLGHSRDTSAQRTVTADEQAVVDAARLWYGYRHTLRATPPKADPRRERTRLRREVEKRDAAAAAPDLRTEVAGEIVPARDALAADLDRVEAGLLCWHFPRERSGRYARRAVVALARYGPDPGKRGPWLTARVRDGALALGVEPLIGVNQDHRWDTTPWLWSAAGRDATPADRWQVASPSRPARSRGCSTRTRSVPRWRPPGCASTTTWRRCSTASRRGTCAPRTPTPGSPPSTPSSPGPRRGASPRRTRRGSASVPAWGGPPPVRCRCAA